MAHRSPVEEITDRAPALANVIDELIPAAFHNTGQYENNRCEADHGRLKARLRPMRGLKTDRTVSVVIQGHAFVQNLRRGHYELGIDAAPVFRLATAFDELQLAIDVILSPPTIPHALRSPNATVPSRRRMAWQASGRRSRSGTSCRSRLPSRSPDEAPGLSQRRSR